jgi:hypothetical protein
MHDLVLHILRLFITFLQGVEQLLTNHTNTPASPTEVTIATPPTTATRSTTPESSTTTATLPISPSTYRGQRIPNTILREEYSRTGVCPHYSHEVPRPRLPTCPVCHQNLHTL